MKMVQMMVTPAQAAEWLKNNPRNRKPVPNVIRAIADDIATGKWLLTHQGIAIGTDGTLYDGQHRLMAVVRADLPVEMIVWFDVTEDALWKIDTGGVGRRKAHHVLKMAKGLDVSAVVRSSVIVAWRVLNGESLQNQGGSHITPQDLSDALDVHGSDAESVCSVMAKNHDRLCQAPSNGALTILHHLWPLETMEFARLVRDGEQLTKGHAAYALRNYLSLEYSPHTRHTKSGVSVKEQLIDRTFGAFDAYRKGEQRMISRANPAAREHALRTWINARLSEQRARGAA